MANKYNFNPFTGSLDQVDDDVQSVSSAPVSGVEGTLYIDSSAPTHSYYFLGGHRYLISSTLDDPAAISGSPMGLLLALTYA